jgi:hypothetical protein
VQKQKVLGLDLHGGVKVFLPEILVAGDFNFDDFVPFAGVDAVYDTQQVVLWISSRFRFTAASK